MFANAPKLALVVVATLYDRVDVRVKNYTQVFDGWCWRDLVTKDIYGKGGCKVFAMTHVAYESEFGFIRIQLQLVFVHQQ